MYFVKTPNIVPFFYPKDLYWVLPPIDKTIYLTFDDGPNPETTPSILKILDQYNAKATFFCVGENVNKYAGLYQDIIAAGHATGNHTFNHLNGWKTKRDVYLNNISKCTEVIDSKLFRPPYGKIKFSQISSLKDKYVIIMWSVLSGDFDKNVSPEQCLDNALKHTKPGAIIVFHDHPKTKEKVEFALPRYLESLSSKGYCFKSINERALSDRP